MATGKSVSYLRVSTTKQGRSGLGLEAQRQAVADYLNGGNWELIREFVEIESGKRDDRPELAKAMHHCKVTGAKLVIAKLDRLSRDAHFLLGLQKAGVQFVAADMPEANETVVGIMAVIAQSERKMISERTKAALKAAKARGVKLGNPNGAAHLKGLSKEPALAAVKENAQRRAEDLITTIEEIRASGITSANGIARELAALNIQTPRGGKWHPTSVKNLLIRIDAASR